ncbi:MAG: hypothetical protein FWD18_07650 [Micrococcales bacterium]|nr:hypothetical protein [Micrococcales bacterium]
MTLPVPRSLVLAAWLSWGGTVDQIIAAVQQDDEPHVVLFHGRVFLLVDFLRKLARGGEVIRPMHQIAVCVFPTPDDPVLDPPVDAAIKACEALVLNAEEGSLALVPSTGNLDDDPETIRVIWQVFSTSDRREAVTDGLHGAARNLPPEGALTSLHTTFAKHAVPRDSSPEGLAELDMTVELIETTLKAELPTWRLPPGLDGWRIERLTSVIRVYVAFNLFDTVATIPVTHLADQRSATTRDLYRMTRWMMTGTTTCLPWMPDPVV